MNDAMSGINVRTHRSEPRKGDTMLNYAIVFLFLGVIVWSAYWAGVPRVPIQLSWVLSSIGVLLLVISVVTGKTAGKGS